MKNNVPRSKDVSISIVCPQEGQRKVLEDPNVLCKGPHVFEMCALLPTMTVHQGNSSALLSKRRRKA